MAQILTPGYLRWDGTKYVLDEDVEIVGPAGAAGPAGSTGPQGAPGIGVGAAATGDLSGTYPGPMSVITLTGVNGLVNYAAGTANPTIGQAATSGSTGQPMTLRGQGAVTTGGDVILQTGTGTTAGIVQFMIGNTTAAAIDANGVLRIGPNSLSGTTIIGNAVPLTGVNYLHAYNGSGSMFGTFISGGAANRAGVEVVNNASGTTLGVGIGIYGAATTHATPQYAGHGIIEQFGAATSAITFTKRLGNGTGLAATGRMYQSGAWAIGDASNNDTSTEAQAGLTGPVLNIGAATGTFTSTAGQALNFNINGAHHVQGHTEVRFDIAANLAGYFDSNRTFRFGPSAESTVPVYTSGVLPIANTGLFLNSAGGTIINGTYCGSTSGHGVVETLHYGSGAANTTGVRLFAPGAASPTTFWQGHGVVDQVGSATSALIFTRSAGSSGTPLVNGRLFQTGAWVIGDSTINDTSSEAQAGLAGPLLNLSPITGGSLTSSATQALNYNSNGSHVVQGGTDVRFITGTNLAGYFDGSIAGGNIPLRVGSAGANNITFQNSTQPSNGVCYYGAGNSANLLLNATQPTTRATGYFINMSSGTATGIAVEAAGGSHSITQYQNNGVIEQIGPSTTALVFARAQHDETGRVITGRVWQSGAWAFGDNIINDTSSEAQAGLTGTVLNISPVAGGSVTTVANQGLVYNVAGQLTLQGNTGVTLQAGTTNVASTTTTKFVTSQGRRVKVTTTVASPYAVLATDEVISVGTIGAPFNVTLPVSPTTGDTYVIKDANGSAGSFNITVQGGAINIDAATNAVINTNYGSITVVYNGTKWITV